MVERGEPGSAGHLVRLVVAVVLGAVLTALAMGWRERPVLTVVGGAGAVALSAMTIVLAARLARVRAELAVVRARPAPAPVPPVLSGIAEERLADRRRLAQDLHDGLQQRLLAVGIQLDMAIHRTRESDAAPVDLLVNAKNDLWSAVAEVRQFSAGLYPAVLESMGLRAAVETLASRLPVPVTVAAFDRRLPPAVEYGVYFLVSEALTNVAKHAQAGRATVSITEAGEYVRVEVTDDGTGGADPAGSGLTGLRARVAELGGGFAVDSRPGQGTTITAEIPCGS